MIQRFIETAKIVSEKFPVLLQGLHGVGKSEVVAQISEQLELLFVNLRLSQMTEGDTLGIPNKEGEFTVFLPPKWLHVACKQPCLLFFDEVDRASEGVRQSIMQLTDSRQLCGNVLHPKTRIFGAGNSGKHGKWYKTGHLDLAEFSRWFVVAFEPSVADFLLWAEKNICPIIVDFLSKNQDHIEHIGKALPTRRAWDRFSQVAKTFLESDVKNPDLVFSLAEGFVGQEASIAFLSFYKEYQAELSVEDILDKWPQTKKTNPSNQSLLGVLRKFDANNVFSQVLKKKQVQNLSEFFWDLTDELFMSAFPQLSSKKEGEEPTNRYSLLNQVNSVRKDGKTLGLRFADLMQGG